MSESPQQCMNSAKNTSNQQTYPLSKVSLFHHFDAKLLRFSNQFQQTEFYVHLCAFYEPYIGFEEESGTFSRSERLYQEIFKKVPCSWKYDNESIYK